MTLGVEGMGMAAAAALLPGWRPHWRTAVLLALAANLVSHTIFWNALQLAPTVTPAVLWLAEAAVAAAEGAVYALAVARPRWSAWPVSLALNWASWAVSAYVWRLFA